MPARRVLAGALQLLISLAVLAPAAAAADNRVITGTVPHRA